MSRRVERERPQMERLNLIPILDAVFIFIFFLLMSAKFINLREIGSDVPVVSEASPKMNKEPLALTLDISTNAIRIKTGLQGKVVMTIGRKNGGYELDKLYQKIIEIKKKNLMENSIVLEPKNGVKYNEIVKIMDEVRVIKKDDEPIYKKVEGKLKRTRKLFTNITFSNMASS